MTLRLPSKSPALFIFLVLYCATYLVKPVLATLYSEPGLELYTMGLGASDDMILGALFAIVFLAAFVLSYSATKATQSPPVGNAAQSQRARGVAVLAVALLNALLVLFPDDSNALIVIVYSVSIVFALYLIICGGWTKWFGILSLGNLAFTFPYSKTYVLFAFAGFFIFLFPHRSLRYIERIKPLSLFAVSLALVLLTGVLQVLRWYYGDYTVLSPSNIIAGFCTAFDGYEYFVAYIAKIDMVPAFTWLSEFYLYLPRFIFEQKPLVYGAALISEYFYPGALSVDETGVGQGQFPPGILVASIDFLWIFGFVPYAVLVGRVIRSIDEFYSSSDLLKVATALFLILQLNTLMRTGLVSFLLYNLVYVVVVFLLVRGARQVRFLVSRQANKA